MKLHISQSVYCIETYTGTNEWKYYFLTCIPSLIYSYSIGLPEAVALRLGSVPCRIVPKLRNFYWLLNISFCSCVYMPDRMN